MNEVVIIGGGLVGLLSAIQLADHGCHSVILEANSPLDSASAKTAGGIYLQLQSQMGLLAQDIQAQAIKTVPLIKEIMPAWKRLKNRFPEIALDHLGGLIVAMNETEMEGLRRKNNLERKHQLETKILDRNEILNLSKDYNSNIVGGSFHPQEGFCHPVPLLKILMKELANSSISLKTNHEVDQIRTTNSGKLEIFCKNRETIRTNKIIIATGAFTGKLLEKTHQTHGIISLPIQMFSADQENIKIPVLTRWIGGKLSVKQFETGEIWIGGGWPAKVSSDQEFEIEIIKDNIKNNLNHAIKIFPKLKTSKIKKSWGGFAAWTKDGIPCLGSLSNFPNTYVACGGNGFSLGPLYSEILRDLILNRPTGFDLSAFQPSRFHGEDSTNPIAIPHD